MKRDCKIIILAIAIILCAPLLVAQNILATSSNVGIKASVPATISLILSADSMDFDLETPALYTETMTLTARTNSPAGYTISFNVDNDYSGLKHENGAIDAEIPSISATTDAAGFPTVGWAYSLESEDFTFKQIPLDAKNIYATTEAGENSHIFTTGVRASNIISGAYSNILLFTATANPVPDTISTLATMQEMNDEVCDASYPAEKKQLMDSRDGKYYWVEKLADGGCWMTQNLDLDLDSTVTLTPETSDVKENWTPLRSTIKGINNLNSDAWQNDKNTPYSFDPGDYYARDGYNPNSDICKYTETTCDNFSTSAYDANGEHGHVGNYYNWSAAVAMNDTSSMTTIGMDAESSICPAGWRLPHGHQSIESADYDNLIHALGANGLDEKLALAPNYMIRAGMISMGTLYYSDYSGSYLTSTVASANDMDDFFVAALNSISSADSRFYGFSIRCVARKTQKTATLKTTDNELFLAGKFEDNYKLPEGPEVDGYNFVGWDEDIDATEPEYEAGDIISDNITLYAIYEVGMLSMQDVASWKNTLSFQQQIQVRDSRDGKVYWVSKLRNGEIWMTQNLDYDLSVTANQTLTSNTSDVKTTRTIVPQISWGANDAGIYYYEGGDIYYVNGKLNTSSLSYLAADSVNRHYAAGDYYSWMAATAGQGILDAVDAEIDESICPAGWRLPTPPTSYSTPYSYSLLKYYGKHDGYYDDGEDDADLIADYLYITHAGNIDYLTYQLVYNDESWNEGTYWTNKAYGENLAYMATFNEYGASVMSSLDYYNGGHNIRCVAR